MSLRWRIMGATVLVVVVTVVVSIGVGYYTTQTNLDEFVDEIGDDEAVQLARSLSREYTAAGGWETVDGSLSEAGYIYGERLGESSGEAQHTEGSETSSRETSEALHHDQVRIVIVGVDGRVVTDNLSELPAGATAPDLDGRRETVFDLAANQPVGHVYVDVNREFLSTESGSFLDTLLYITLVGGALTVGVAVLLAAWLSKRITAPVTALTEATQAIAHGDAARLPVASSDELGQMSAAFNQMTSTLETQRELRRRLINDVSHELNTPLSVILLEARGLRDGLQTAESASDHIIEEVDRLRGLVTDLDWLAETDHGETRLSVQASSMQELLAAEVERWQPQSQARQVELSLQATDDLPPIDLDRMRMSQALGNVVSNAIHCTEAGGSVVVRAEREDSETLAVSIADDGIGIDAEDLPHLFDRFYRTDQSRGRGISGTGLGLAITKAIVEAHEGTTTVTSDGPGLGATVTIRLPV
ncbi:MAG: HAMP domain-containing sensor histidine kinase [Acidimicrobiaceae bacterium]|nr:HAMP domain-containing sensor histidine kinase [Acidimicrobiaceae bacterium]MDE0516220.1 HAMP domain-containing sensor histidine kinase [Acidimicrobiaceae bacterium]